MAKQRAGIDLTDQRALDEYRDVYNHQLAAPSAARFCSANAWCIRHPGRASSRL